MKKNKPNKDSIPSLFAKKYIYYYYAFFWIILLLVVFVGWIKILFLLLL